MTKDMKTKLTKYLNDHAATILETAGTHSCDLKYRPSCGNRVYSISIAFTKNLHSTDPVSYVVGDLGFVLVVPSYWLSISTDLAYAYIEYFVDEYMKENIFSNGNTSGDSTGGNTGNNGGCGCPNKPNQPVIPPNKPCKPPLEVNLHDDPNNQLSGYFIPGQ